MRPHAPRQPSGRLILQVVAIVVVAVGILAAPLLAVSQPVQKVFRVGYLAIGGRTPAGAPPVQLREAMRSLGYVEGKNVAYEARFAEGRADRLPGLTAELIRLKADIIATNGGPATMAAKQATSTIPIVMAPAAGDAVAIELVASLARPGANVTGLTDESVQLSAKRMELLKEAVPQASRIAVLWNTDDEGMMLRYREIERAARTLRVEVQALGVRHPDDFAAAFSAMTQRRPDAMFLVADGLTTGNRKLVVAFAAAQRIPAMYEWNFIVREGGLMSYGVSMEDTFGVAARYIDRIFKGANPATLPAEQPTRYYLTVNRKTAETFGPHPPTVAAAADGSGD